jgi:hypothetical protein
MFCLVFNRGAWYNKRFKVSGVSVYFNKKNDATTYTEHVLTNIIFFNFLVYDVILYSAFRLKIHREVRCVDRYWAPGMRRGGGREAGGQLL